VSDSSNSDAEYKLVTILFADVVGSTDLTTRLGAEKARVVFDRCLQRMSAAVDEYGGTVARLMGDGLLAFFGAPQAHEDDPERAVMAAIRMHESVEAYASELGETVLIRVGLNTGRAVLGEVGAFWRSDWKQQAAQVKPEWANLLHGWLDTDLSWSSWSALKLRGSMNPSKLIESLARWFTRKAPAGSPD
jgi:class 3 adenylate cyclase